MRRNNLVAIMFVAKIWGRNITIRRSVGTELGMQKEIKKEGKKINWESGQDRLQKDQSTTHR